jgi:thymidylate synthase (FAD)
MKVQLISYSQSADPEQRSLSLIDWIAYVARVSNPANQSNTETSSRLVSYLAKNKHWSPFEMVSVCLEIETTRDIARQILRHRSFSFQEFSQRYAEVDLTDSTPFVVREARLQDWKNRQNSVSLDSAHENTSLATSWEALQREVQGAAGAAYSWALENGIAKEQARCVLPEGMTPSRLYMSGSLRSWIHYIELRSGNGTQKEHREVALACADALEPIFPMIRDYVSGNGS